MGKQVFKYWGFSPEKKIIMPKLSDLLNSKDIILLDSAMGNSQTQKPEQVAARCLLQAMTKLKCRPKEILMSRTGLAFALEPITRPLDIRTSHLAKLKGIDRIYRRLLRSIDLDRC